MKEESELRERERILFSVMQYMPLCCDEQNATNRSAMNCTVTDLFVSLFYKMDKRRNISQENVLFYILFHPRYDKNMSKV